MSNRSFPRPARALRNNDDSSVAAVPHRAGGVPELVQDVAASAEVRPARHPQPAGCRWSGPGGVPTFLITPVRLLGWPAWLGQECKVPELEQGM